MHFKNKILFICKKNEVYGQQLYTRRSAGLFNSTRFIVEALREQGLTAEIVEVQDNNEIDRVVHQHRPQLVVLEALWVVPEKFEVLKGLHPHVQWFVHLHSDMPFLAQEGIAMDWIIRYQEAEVGIVANSEECFEALSPIVDPCLLFFLPNVYLSEPKEPKIWHRARRKTVNVGCFGAIRPLKNHLLQALAALEFARENEVGLHFHINTGRVETGGEPVLKNLRQLFKDLPGAELVEHHWFEPDAFIAHLHSQVDIGLQVSLTETFNVVTADYITAGLPVVVSKEVKWVSNFCKAVDNSLPDIVAKMTRVIGNRYLTKWNQILLHQTAEVAARMWLEFCLEH